jgi:hypothetical protein
MLGTHDTGRRQTNTKNKKLKLNRRATDRPTKNRG